MDEQRKAEQQQQLNTEDGAAVTGGDFASAGGQQVFGGTARRLLCGCSKAVAKATTRHPQRAPTAAAPTHDWPSSKATQAGVKNLTQRTLQGRYLGSVAR